MTHHMKGESMTLSDLLQQLEHLPQDAGITYTTPSGAIAGGYHVTELRLAQLRRIDCAGTQSCGSEAVMQLLDGRGGDHMSVGRLRMIVAQSLNAIEGLGEAPLSVEAGVRNEKLEHFDVTAPHVIDGAVRIDLKPQSAQCRVLNNAAAGLSEAMGCCG